MKLLQKTSENHTSQNLTSKLSTQKILAITGHFARPFCHTLHKRYQKAKKKKKNNLIETPYQAMNKHDLLSTTFLQILCLI